jgi:hypothetical protein
MELNNLKQESQNIRMSAAEKSSMKARIFGVPTLSPAQSPYFFFSYQFVQARVLAPLAVVLVVFAGAGTAAAAQGALPGDILYPVKVSVNEAVEVALATTPVAKAQVQATLAQRRVEEAEALSQNGKLTPDTSAALAANFETHAQAAQALATDVAAQDPEAGQALRTTLASSLSAHGAILATLGDDSSTTAPQNKDGSDTLATRVLARAGEGQGDDSAAKAAITAAPQAKVQTMIAFSAKIAADEATGTEATTATSTPGQIKLKGKAAQALLVAHQRFDDVKGSLDATTTAQVEARLAQIDTLVAQGEYARALVASIRLSTLLAAQQKLDKNVITPVLEDHAILNTSDDTAGSLPEGEGVGL